MRRISTYDVLKTVLLTVKRPAVPSGVTVRTAPLAFGAADGLISRRE